MEIEDARHLAIQIVNEACRNRGPNSPIMSFVRLWNITKLNFFIATNRHFIQGSSRSEVEKLLSSHLVCPALAHSPSAMSSSVLTQTAVQDPQASSRHSSHGKPPVAGIPCHGIVPGPIDPGAGDS